MKLEIERWLHNQEFNEDVNNLFEESIICYKASAYRASFLFSFLGFQSIIKERILKAEKPMKYNEKSWEAVQKNLRNEDKWDTEVIESIKKSNDDKKIFNITQDLREQSLYWKGRRNDCAHSKQNTINYSHVESFWLFLISNLPKFYVEGGYKSLLQKIYKYFDLNFTSKNADFQGLIQEVPYAVDLEEADSFLGELHGIIDSLEDDDYYDRGMSFYNELIKLNLPISLKTIDLIKEDSARLEEMYLGTYPEHLNWFYSDDENVRFFWRKKLTNMHSKKFIIFAALLRNGLINKEKEEAMDHFIEKIYAERDSLSTEIITELKSHGYFERYQYLVFEEGLINNFDWANLEGRYTIAEHLDQLGLNIEIVQKLTRTFNGPHPFDMKKELVKYFSDSSKKAEFIKICESLGSTYTPPERLGF